MAAMSLLSTPPEESAVARPTPHADELPLPSVSSGVTFFAASALLYAGVIILAALTLNAYFARTWDVATFIDAAHRFMDGGNPLDLYAQSRAAQTWPYAYPPLHALVVAAALLIGDVLRVLPDYIWARVPALLADIGVALMLYVIVRRKSNDQTLARAAMLLWLFNPLTFYDTAVQGHFESEWLLLVLLAYAWFEHSHEILLPTAALAVAVLFKQVAILFTIPLWASVTLGPAQRLHPGNAILRSAHNDNILRLLTSLILFALIVGAVCLPFLLYSDDFWYMNLTYVESVPVQTQSWLVALLGITRAPRDALTSDFFLLRYSTIITLLAVAAIAFLGARRGFSLYLTAMLIALAFFLTSKKVMGYYYVMLLPFLLAECLPKRRFDLVLIAILATAWISLSPYYAAWSNPDHWWIYALLGSLNSLFFVWLFEHLWRGAAPAAPLNNVRATLFVSLGLFAGAAFAAILQPLISSPTSPIRAPIITPGMEWSAVAAFSALVALTLSGLTILARWMPPPARAGTAWGWGIVLIFAPLFFAVYTLTKESTAIFEMALGALGV
jgi:hypothetical protein